MTDLQDTARDLRRELAPLRRELRITQKVLHVVIGSGGLSRQQVTDRLYGRATPKEVRDALDQLVEHREIMTRQIGEGAPLYGRHHWLCGVTTKDGTPCTRKVPSEGYLCGRHRAKEGA